MLHLIAAMAFLLSAQPEEGAQPILSAETRIVYGETVRREVLRLTQGYEMTLMRARRRADELAEHPDWRFVEALSKAVEDAEAAMDADDLPAAYDRLDSWRARSCEQAVEKRILEAIPFLAIGPFGDETFTDMGSAGLWLRPDPDPLNMPFLNEYEGTPVRMSYLPKDFGPLRRPGSIGFGGAPVAWQEAWKTDTLGFDEVHAPDGQWAVAYLYTEVFSPRERGGCYIQIDAENTPGLMMWVNGRLYLHMPPPEDPATASGYGFSRRQGGFVLARGWKNTLLLKVVQRPGTTVDLQFQDRDRRPVSGLRFRLPDLAAAAE